MSDVDHTFQDEITCPNCGHKQDDSWECSYSEYEHDCECGATFISTPNPSVTYCTHLVKMGEPY